MTVVDNPAWQAFLAQLGDECLFAQIRIRRLASGYEVRHGEDRERNADSLRVVPLDLIRDLAQFTAEGAFRPLKSAPNLAAGWRIVAPDDPALARVLDQLYPGAVPDWFAAQGPSPPVTQFRDFTARQSGMYRATRLLTDAQAERVARACCARDLCLKRRLWTAGNLGPDPAPEKSVIPCLEPCAILLESARKAVRTEQEAGFNARWGTDEAGG